MPLDRGARAPAVLKTPQAVQQRRLVQVTEFLRIRLIAQDTISYISCMVSTNLPVSAEAEPARRCIIMHPAA